MKKVLVILLIVLFGAVSFACTVNEDVPSQSPIPTEVLARNDKNK